MEESCPRDRESLCRRVIFGRPQTKASPTSHLFHRQLTVDRLLLLCSSCMSSVMWVFAFSLTLLLWLPPPSHALTLLVRQPTAFLGSALGNNQRRSTDRRQYAATITMRKQKASDRRTRRRQRGEIALEERSPVVATVTANPMQGTVWKAKKAGLATAEPPASSGGRGRSRKRTTLYQTLRTYHGSFLNPLTAEYQAEVSRLVVVKFLTWSLNAVS